MFKYNRYVCIGHSVTLDCAHVFILFIRHQSLLRWGWSRNKCFNFKDMLCFINILTTFFSKNCSRIRVAMVEILGLDRLFRKNVGTIQAIYLLCLHFFGFKRRFLIPLIFLMRASTSRFFICNPMKWWYPHVRSVSQVLLYFITDIVEDIRFIYPF